MAGVSVDYYLRLEQGRGGQPSEQLLRALADVLQLDQGATNYLLSFIAPQPLPRVPDSIEQVPGRIQNLLDIIGLPAFVTGQTFDVLASNNAARAISPELVPGRNRLRSVFLDDRERALYRDWPATTERFVAIVRETLGQAAADPDVARLVDELNVRSPRFNELWLRHDIAVRDTEAAVLQHPVVGELRLHLERLNVPGVIGQSLIVYHAEAGSNDATRLDTLLSDWPRSSRRSVS